MGAGGGSGPGRGASGSTRTAVASSTSASFFLRFSAFDFLWFPFCIAEVGGIAECFEGGLVVARGGC